MTTLIGPLVSTWDVEQAVIKTIKVWLNVYLAEVEEQRGLQRGSIGRPPTPESIHGGTEEAIAWKQDELPAVIVVVVPNGEPEVSASVGYVQAYEVTVYCIGMGDEGVQQTQPEDSARQQVAHFGAAVMALLQHGELQQELPQLQWVRMTSAPKPEVPETEKRREQACVTIFSIWVAPIIEQQAGPTGLTPAESPGYTGVEEPFEPAPTAKDGEVTVIGEPTGTPL